MTSGQSNPQTEPSQDNSWTDSDLDALRASFGLKEEAFLARELGRSVEEVRAKAAEILSRDAVSGPWSPVDVDALRRYLGGVATNLLAQMLGRSVEDLEAKLVELATTLSDTPLTGPELIRFKRLYGTRADADLAIIFGRTLDRIHGESSRLCLSKDKAYMRRKTSGAERTRMPRWTEPELQTLRQLYSAESNLQIAQQLGRSVKSVVSKAHNLGLKKDKARLEEMGRQNVRLRYDRGSSSQ
ncbi:MAG: hypothetical protein P8M11_17205 [Planctomycetota bacterium]|nr:hypothetical protein [Planctomycetota bacterium]MDG1986294.1 hypothetical protein [Planctomycetota bacterium]